MWSQALGTTGRDIGWGIAVDPSDNVFVTGAFVDSIDCGGGTLVGWGDWDVFLSKFDPYGNHVWSRAFGGTGSDIGLRVAADAAGNVITLGTFQDTAYFGGDQFVSGAPARDDIFLLKHDADGNQLWSKSFGGYEFEYPGGVVVEPSGNIIISGAFQSPTDFGGGALTTIGSWDVFLAKLDPDGNHIWSQNLGGTSFDRAFDVDVLFNGKIFITGSFYGTASFGGAPLVSAGVNDIFVAKYDANGSHLWSKRYGDNNSNLQEGIAIAVDSGGNVAVAGYFSGTVDFGGGALSSVGLGSDMFLAHLGPGSGHQWSKRLGGAGSDFASSLAIDGDDNVLLTGYFLETVDFGGGAVSSVNHSEDIFVAQYDPAGTHLWSQTFGGPAQADRGEGVVVDGADNVLLTGQFKDAVDFGGGPITTNPVSKTDAFVVKYGDGPTGVRPWTPAFNVSLDPMYPNPFNPSTRIEFSLDREADVTLVVYDVAGRRIATLVDSKLSPGPHTSEWNGLSTSGEEQPSGVYFFRLTVASESLTRKAVLLK